MLAKETLVTTRLYVIPTLILLAMLVALPSVTPPLRAAEDSQADLDKAVDLKFQATTPRQLDQVAKLCEQAIEKGLNADDESFAVRLHTGALYERVRPQVELLARARRLPPELKERRKTLVADLRRLLKYDDKFGQAYLMIAQLEGIDGGDRKAARIAVDKAIERLEKDKKSLAEAFLVRGQIQEREEQRVADFDRAVELDPDNVAVWQTRAFYYLVRGEVDKAIADFNSLLQRDESNLLAQLAIADTLMKLGDAGKIDEAMKHVNRVIETKPNVVALKLRAQLWTNKERLDKALEDVETAMKLATRDLELYLMRARLYHLEGRNALAKEDVEKVLQVRPNFPPALDLRSTIAVAMGQFDAAIADIKTLLKQEPDNTLYKLQLAIYLNAAGKSARAVEVFSDVLKTDPGNTVAFRGRADAYLNMGNHKQALADYEVAVKSAMDDSGILNNFAWVLATSPNDALRDGKRAIELALKACELTEYKQAHILSTLAAAYAEAGDFKNAVKWSEKACATGDSSIQGQLKLEQESYKQEKPWREVKAEAVPQMSKTDVEKNANKDDKKNDKKNDKKDAEKATKDDSDKNKKAQAVGTGAAG